MQRAVSFEDCGVENTGLNQILKEVTAVTEFRSVTGAAFGYFDNYIKLAEITEFRRNTKFGRRSPDPARGNENHMFAAVPQLPVDCGKCAFYGVLIVVPHLIVGNRINVYDHVYFKMSGKAHGDTLRFCENLPDTVFFREDDRFSVFVHLKRSALQKIDHVFPVFRDIDGVFDIYRIVIFLLKQAQDFLHITHQGLVVNQALA